MNEPASGAADDPVELIERALTALRRSGRGPGPHHGRHELGQGPHAHGGHRDRSSRAHRAVGPMGGPPWTEADGGDAGAPPWARRGPRGAWEFRTGPMASLRLLATLQDADRPMSVTELAAAIGVDQPRASRLVQAAVKDGLVVREADPDDARRTRVRLTASGAAVVRDATSHRRRAIEAALEEFTDEERVQFARLFARFARGLHLQRP